MKCYSTKSNGDYKYNIVLDEQDVRVFDITKGPKSIMKMSNVKDLHRPDYGVNSVLVHVKDLEYVHIGEDIIKFVLKCPVLTFMSSINDASILEPWCIDSDGHVVLILRNERVIITTQVANVQNPFDVFYESENMDE